MGKITKKVKKKKEENCRQYPAFEVPEQERGYILQAKCINIQYGGHVHGETTFSNIISLPHTYLWYF